MVQSPQSEPKSEIIYPDSDGQPMSDNTKQFRWIVTIKENLERLFADNPNVFVAGDLLWYPIEGSNTVRQAPDAMVVLGRPKGDRGSYQQWKEDNICPQVVFEILSPGNRLKGLASKFQFYQQYGVEEYYMYDPDDIELIGWRRTENYLDVIEEMNGWVSPLLGIRFEMNEELKIYFPSGEPFLTFVELAKLRDEAVLQRDEAVSQRDEAVTQRDEALTQLEQERQRNQALIEQLRQLQG